MPKAASDGMARYLCCAASQGVSYKLPKLSDNLLKQNNNRAEFIYRRD